MLCQMVKFEVLQNLEVFAGLSGGWQFFWVVGVIFPAVLTMIVGITILISIAQVHLHCLLIAKFQVMQFCPH